MKIKALVDMLTEFLGRFYASAHTVLVPKSEEIGEKLATDMLDGMERGFQRKILERSPAFSDNIIVAESRRIESKTKRKARGK